MHSPTRERPAEAQHDTKEHAMIDQPKTDTARVIRDRDARQHRHDCHDGATDMACAECHGAYVIHISEQLERIGGFLATISANATTARHEREDTEARQDDACECGWSDEPHSPQEHRPHIRQDDPDEALAKVLRGYYVAGHPHPGEFDPWDETAARYCDLWRHVARVARAHIYSEPDQTWVTRDIDEAERRAVKAEAERDAYKRAKAENDERFQLEAAEQRARAEKAEAERDRVGAALRDDVQKARDERDGWKAKHAALREDVEALRHNPKSLTDVLMRAADNLDRDDDRTPQDDPDTVTLRREDVEDILATARVCGVTEDRVRKALGWGDES